MGYLNIPPRFIRSFMMIIGLVFISYLFHPTEIKLVEGICNVDAIISCGRFLFIPEFQCDDTNGNNADSKCREEHCAGDDEVATTNDCCLARAAIPTRWTVQLEFLFDPNPAISGDYCCCDPEMNSVQVDDEETNGGGPTSETEDANNVDDSYSQNQQGPSRLTQYFLTRNMGPTPLVNPEAEIDGEDRRECLPPIPFFDGDCTDELCERTCRGYEGLGDHPIHVCKSLFKCCCNYDAARNLVTPYDELLKSKSKP